MDQPETAQTSGKKFTPVTERHLSLPGTISALVRGTVIYIGQLFCRIRYESPSDPTLVERGERLLQKAGASPREADVSGASRVAYFRMSLFTYLGEAIKAAMANLGLTREGIANKYGPTAVAQRS